MSFEVTFACDSMVFLHSSTLSLILLSSSLCYLQHASSHAASSTFLGVHFKGISSFHHGVQSVAVARLLSWGWSLFCALSPSGILEEDNECSVAPAHT